MGREERRKRGGGIERKRMKEREGEGIHYPQSCTVHSAGLTNLYFPGTWGQCGLGRLHLVV